MKQLQLKEVDQAIINTVTHQQFLTALPGPSWRSRRWTPGMGRGFGRSGDSVGTQTVARVPFRL